MNLFLLNLGIVAIVFVIGWWLLSRKPKPIKLPDNVYHIRRCRMHAEQIIEAINKCRTTGELTSMEQIIDGFYDDNFNTVDDRVLKAIYKNLNLAVTVRRHKLEEPEKAKG